jgi:hypothetical protein
VYRGVARLYSRIQRFLELGGLDHCQDAQEDSEFRVPLLEPQSTRVEEETRGKTMEGRDET